MIEHLKMLAFNCKSKRSTSNTSRRLQRTSHSCSRCKLCLDTQSSPPSQPCVRKQHSVRVLDCHCESAPQCNILSFIFSLPRPFSCDKRPPASSRLVAKSTDKVSTLKRFVGTKTVLLAQCYSRCYRNKLEKTFTRPYLKDKEYLIER